MDTRETRTAPSASVPENEAPAQACVQACHVIPTFRLRVDRRGESWHAFDRQVCFQHLGEQVEAMTLQFKRITVQQYNPATGNVVSPT